MRNTQQQPAEPGEDAEWRAQLLAEGKSATEHGAAQVNAGRAEDRLLKRLAAREHAHRASPWVQLRAFLTRNT